MSMKIRGQYIKDLSFENPNAPFLVSNNAPDINVTVNINAVKLEHTDGEEKVDEKQESFHEITLHIETKAIVQDGQEKENVAFMSDIKYCGVFSIDSSFTEEELKQVLFIQAPTFLFPFAREIIARITNSGGFPPLMLEPIDFKAMYYAQSRQKN
ncbi:protein-export chaperone SecB [Wolbachia pipientis]|uniref:Protein-export protein SecB n=1 Tax=Wolbachia pipientis TaxID=955 RepID=A0A1E7QJT8_WOLPI|nr:protein-export chaperone SecB [Wolbachia pipientis]OEY86723.1 protein-export chaperone SecB [Wolbachia pipientis]